MARNLQNCYCDYDSCEQSAARETTKDGRQRLIYADALGYWYFVPGFAKPPKPNHATAALTPKDTP